MEIIPFTYCDGHVCFSPQWRNKGLAVYAPSRRFSRRTKETLEETDAAPSKVFKYKEGQVSLPSLNPLG
ncbi:hypothetical protein Y032_0038g3599 [Ancylostoma ceylanicum]|uniref:Uncharacterized protein n=1 Tax=Ancylostoma ceylanicum TaxID=53326 RepID=A0A016UI79_9BILA|nr:hypothetical protein Y032_0038g3599 [Ancylostoma ceylanicum]